MNTASAFPAMTLAQADGLLTAPGSPFEVGEAVIRGMRQKVWKNAPPTLRDLLLHARGHGKATFMVYEDDRVDYASFYQAAAGFAVRLRADGIEPGDRVALVMRNLPEWPVAFFGAILAGAVVAPLNAWWTAGELSFGLEDSGAKAAIFDAERYDRFFAGSAAPATLKLVYTARHAAPRGAARMEDIVGPPAAWATLPETVIPDAPLEPDGDAVIFYTSGTSGKPKGALATHRGIGCNAIAAPYAVARAYLRRGQTPPQPDPTAPQKAYLAGIPFFHVTGFCALLQVSMFMGFKVVMMRRWNAEEALALVEREGVTHAGGVPTLAWQMVQSPEVARHDTSTLESITYGGAPAAPELVRELGETFPAAAAGFGWGMSETCATFTLNMAEDYVQRPSSSGQSFPVGELRIRDDAGVDLPTGEIGEIWAKGPNVVKGYWNNPTATAETIVDGWLRTGDLGRLDDEGFLYVVDRAKDMIIRGGENIYCIEVENTLFEHPAVADAALQAIPHQTLGEEPGAVVLLKPGATVTEAELQAFVGERLAAFKVPRKVLFTTEPLPRNANGKVMKAAIKQMLLEA